MTTTQASIGMNKTGVGTSPRLAQAMIEATDEFPPSDAGDERGLAVERIVYAQESDPMGSVPPPPSLKGVLKAVAQGLSGTLPTLFIDKLGERLAFERTGVRIYEALLAKFDQDGGFDGGPTRSDLELILRQEHAHFRLLETAIRGLGADPTVVTPSANFHATMAQGILSAVTDPRTSLVLGLEAALLIELADNDCWEALLDFAARAGETEMVEHFGKCIRDEEEHLRLVRGWIAAAQERVPT